MTSTSLGGTKELATNTEPEKNISKSNNLPCAKASAQMLETPTSWRPSPPELPDVSEMDFLMGTVSATLKLMDTPAAMFDKLSPDPSPSPVPRHDPVQYGPFMRALTTDPLLEISKEAAAELIQQWCDGVGMLYPIIDRQKMLDTAHGVLTTLRYVQDNGVALHRGALIETLFNEETNKLKLILAISRTMECGPEDKTARRLFQSITEVVDSLVLNLTSIGRLQILLLAALYYYHIDEEVISGRIVGLAARLCLEIGLHRRPALEASFPNPDERLTALRTLWSIYMLERRISLGQLMPFMIQDACVDPSLFATLNHHTQQCTPSIPSHLRGGSNLALSSFLDLAKLSGKTWQALVNHGETSSELRVENLSYLDYQVAQWYGKLPGDLTLNHFLLRQCDQQHTRIYIQAVLFFQNCQLRNAIHGQILQSATFTNQNEAHVQTAAQIAKNTIQTLADLNEKTPFVRNHPIFFKYPLLTALSNLLTAAARSGPETSKAEIGIALSLFELLSMRSRQVMRIWQRLEGIQALQALLYSSTPDERSVGAITPPEHSPPEPFPLEVLLDLYPLV
ncbi:hypothetical protein BHE90_012304 [Fusarium euwallaceae]|uniref:Xylanolytic transcriptional activator regulatory domain-containing protein n=1 Tax=Fusarium euwallaceae TaxID=1147111 RepID=A0A430LC39_9HYPO|nr:hypothetical protein BHE90_012304 [Fusarium euwallaceae]